MELKRSIENNLVIWEYEKLAVLGVYGRLDKPLEEIIELYNDSQLEFGRVKKEPNRDFLAAFYFEPPIDVTLVKTEGNEGSIVTYSLDRGESKKLIDKMVEISGLIIHKPEMDFIETIENEVRYIETLTYEKCRQIPEYLNADLERIFGAVHYANFLNKYKGFSQEDSMKMAADRFSVKLPI